MVHIFPIYVYVHTRNVVYNDNWFDLKSSHGFAISLPRSLKDLIAGSEFDISVDTQTLWFLRWVDILVE